VPEKRGIWTLDSVN